MSHIRTGLTRVGMIALFLACYTPWAHAAPAPVILGAYPNLDAGTIAIQGTGFGGSPLVTLGGTNLVVQQSSDTEILATLPASLAEG